MKQRAMNGADQLALPLLRVGLSQADEYTYWNFFLDWGPHSLANLFRFCRTLSFKLRNDRLKGKVIKILKTLAELNNLVANPAPHLMRCSVP